MKSCLECPARSKCVQLCDKMNKYVNGNKQRKETLIDRQADYIPQSDYNDKIYELMIDKETRDIERLEAIRSIPDYRRRMIFASILVGIPQKKIALICHIDQAVISKTYRGLR